MFEGFESATVDTGDTSLFIRRGGNGPPLLLLHGFPQTHVMWHRVAPVLAERFTVICADLRGYGASGKPASRSDHSPYAKRTMALDMVRLMTAQGFERFGVVGHDRGARVAYRLALDHGKHVERLAVLDVIPTSDAFARADARFALAFWPWSLLSQPAPLPESLLAGAPAAVIADALSNWGSDAVAFPAEVRAAYIAALSDRESIHAICEEYRAAATLDLEQDKEDRLAGRRIGCPLLVLWSAGSALDTWYQDIGGPLTVWKNWAEDVKGRPWRAATSFLSKTPRRPRRSCCNSSTSSSRPGRRACRPGRRTCTSPRRRTSRPSSAGPTARCATDPGSRGSAASCRRPRLP
jgi:haloacetate dehalogenase